MEEANSEWRVGKTYQADLFHSLPPFGIHNDGKLKAMPLQRTGEQLIVRTSVRLLGMILRGTADDIKEMAFRRSVAVAAGHAQAADITGVPKTRRRPDPDRQQPHSLEVSTRRRWIALPQQFGRALDPRAAAHELIKHVGNKS